MGEADVVVENRSAARVFRINRPQARNALSVTVRRRLADDIVAADQDAAVRAIIVTGGAEVFAAGGDIKEFMAAGAAEIIVAELQRIWLPIANCSKPIIAAVEGLAFGGGAELALHADIIVASEAAKFAFPEVTLGILPGAGGTQRFPRAVGKYRALRYLLTGDRFSAREA
jgi:enoyl-CoA hydratase